MKVEEKKGIFDICPITLPKRYIREIDLDSWNFAHGVAQKEFQQDVSVEIFSIMFQKALFSKMKSISYRPIDKTQQGYQRGNAKSPESDLFDVLKNISRFKDFVINKDKEKINFKSHNVDQQINQFIQHSLFKYDVPNCFYGFWKKQTDKKVLKRTLLIGNGESPREVYTLSKSENKYFFESNYLFESERCFLSYLTARASGCSVNLSLRLSNFWGNHFGTTDAGFNILSKKASTWFANQGFFDYNHIKTILDYITSNTDVRVYDFSGKTINSLLRTCEEWHDSLKQVKVYKHNTWKDHDLSYKIPNSNEYFIELTTASQLKAEGTAQRNCVLSYWKSCSAERCAIVSLRNSKRSKITIEINLSEKMIVQAKGSCNTLINNDDYHKINQYARIKNLSFGNIMKF